MQKRDIRATRPDGRLAWYRVYSETSPPLAVDSARALSAIRYLGTFRARYLWTIRLLRLLALGQLGVAIVLARAYAPLAICAAGLSAAAYLAVRGVAADFVQQIVQQHPELRRRFVAAGLVRYEVPVGPPRTVVEWASRGLTGPG